MKKLRKKHSIDKQIRNIYIYISLILVRGWCVYNSVPVARCREGLIHTDELIPIQIK